MTRAEKNGVPLSARGWKPVAQSNFAYPIAYKNRATYTSRLIPPLAALATAEWMTDVAGAAVFNCLSPARSFTSAPRIPLPQLFIGSHRTYQERLPGYTEKLHRRNCPPRCSARGSVPFFFAIFSNDIREEHFVRVPLLVSVFCCNVHTSAIFSVICFP